MSDLYIVNLISNAIFVGNRSNCRPHWRTTLPHIRIIKSTNVATAKRHLHGERICTNIERKTTTWNGLQTKRKRIVNLVRQVETHLQQFKFRKLKFNTQKKN